MTLVDAFRARAAAHPARTAIVEASGRAISYGELERRIDACAGAYAERGVRAGARVLTTLPVSIDLYASLAALWTLGATVVFPEPAMGLAGLRAAADAARPDAWLAPRLWRTIGLLWPELRRIPTGVSPPTRDAATGAAAKREDRSVDEVALISFTSGSTGRPKGIARTHGFLLEQARCLEPLLRPDGAEIDLVAFPVFVLAGLGLGVTSVLPNWNLRKPAEADADAVLAHAARHGVTRLLLQPSICEKIADRELPASVRAVLTGGGPVFPDLLRRLSARAKRVVAVYGSTEAEPIADLDVREISTDDWAAMDRGRGILAGKPIAQAQVRIRDDEILVAGPHVNSGYLDPAQDSSTKIVDASGVLWHRTGDAGRFDDSGRLWLLGRLDARVGGRFPFGVEAAARLWPGVKQVALAEIDGAPALAIAGDAAHRDDWRGRAGAMGIETVVALAEIPLDRRHGSKVDYTRLRKAMSESGRQ